VIQRVIKKTGLPALLIFTGAQFALTATAMILAFGYHDQLGNLKGVILTRCLQRSTVDQANRAAVGGQLTYLKSQQSRARLYAPTTRALILTFPPALRPKIRQAQREQARALAAAIHSSQKAYDSGVIGNCAVYR